jgi:glycosyltransferase involved in cell wall biosynthesis
LAVLERWDDPRIGVFRAARNGGAAQTRNAGVAVARCEFVAFQDSDDEWLPDLLAAHRDGLATADVSFCQLDQRYGNQRRLYPEPGWQIPADLFEFLLNSNVVSTQALAVRKSAFVKLGGFDVTLPAMEDWDMALRLAGADLRFHYIPQPLAVAYDSPDSLTRNIHKNINGREQLLAKQADALAARPAMMARHHYIMGSLSHKIGHRPEAIRHFAAAMKLRPLVARIWVKWLLATLG